VTSVTEGGRQAWDGPHRAERPRAGPKWAWAVENPFSIFSGFRVQKSRD
jgi:hypothetical protein